MRHTFKIRFYCRACKTRKDGTAPVECSVIVDGQRQFIILPKSCKPADFPTPDLKIYCTGVENRINEIYTALSVADEPITSYIIKDIYLNGARKISYTIGDMFADGLKLKMKQNTEPATYRKYELTKEHFIKLLELNPNREAGSITHNDILTFKAALDAKYKQPTVEKILMRTKYFFLLAFNSGKIRTNPFGGIKIKHVDSSIAYLEESDLQKIRDAEIDNDRIDKVRDVFLFLCGTGLEWADLRVLEPTDVQTRNTLHFIKKKRVKTGVEYLSILTDEAWDIWTLYGGKLPVISPQKFNLYLKELGKTSKLSNPEISSLVARHTYATGLLNKGLSIEVVSKMLGHTTTSQTRVYAKLLDTSVFEANERLKEEKGSITPEKPISPQNSLKSGKKQKIEPVPEDWEEELDYFSEKMGLK